jgi:hypothetical protein
VKFWKAVFWRTPFLRYRWQRFARDLIPSLALYTLCWVTASTGSTLLGFFEPPFKGEFRRRKKAGIFRPKKNSAPMGAPIAGAKKNKKNRQANRVAIARPVRLCRLMQCAKYSLHIEPASVKLATQQVQCDAR